MDKKKENRCNFRIGHGYDVHKLVKGRKLFLGGIEIPFDKGLDGHSDADVVLHSICDALLGAASMRDIGFHFPDTSAQYENIDSKILLKKTYDLLKIENYEVNNIDVTVCLQKPKLKDFIPKMIKTISEILNIPENAVSIKATTTEKLGLIGREEGISSTCVALIYKT